MQPHRLNKQISTRIQINRAVGFLSDLLNTKSQVSSLIFIYIIDICRIRFPLYPNNCLTCITITCGTLFLFGQGKKQIFLFFHDECSLRLFSPYLLTSFFTLLLLKMLSKLYSFPLTSCSEANDKEKGSINVTWQKFGFFFFFQQFYCQPTHFSNVQHCTLSFYFTFFNIKFCRFSAKLTTQCSAWILPCNPVSGSKAIPASAEYTKECNMED